ncbi:cytochrome P450 2A6-like [Pelobates fuscus]|uniref:cytochrome P450 2A6-like n=1 Tax=Pelobates fuscus TaxID=191477 RepID=UPI002FE472E3
MFDLKLSVLALLIFVTFILILSLGKWAWRWRKMPPGPLPLPILGNYLQLSSGGIIPCLIKLSEQYGPVFTVYFGSRPNVVLVGYDAVKEILVDHGDSILGRGEIPIFFDLYNRRGMSVISGDAWKQLRQFSLMTLRDFGMGKKTLEEPIQTEAQHLTTYFRNLNHKPIDPTNVLVCATSNLLAALLMGTRYNYDDKKWMKSLDDMRKAFSLASSPCGQLYDMFPSLMRILPGNHQNIFKLFQDLKNTVKEQVRNHIETLDPANPRDYIDCYLIRMKQENEKNPETPFDTVTLVSTVFDMFLGGAETTALSLKFGFLILIKFPEIQECLHEEIDQVIGRARDPVVEDKNNTPYLNAFLHEALRFSDVLPMGVARRATKDVNFRGFLIPKGMDILPMLTTVLHDPSHFETPSVFNVKHFLDENGKFKKNNAFLAFAAGKRNCIGESLVRMEIYIFFAIILQKFTLKATVDPKDLDINPVECGFESSSPVHEIIFIPRE